jgi:hypothetical protein
MATKLPASCHQFRQFTRLLVWRLAYCRADHGGKVCQYRSIQPVGLGQDAGGLGKVAHLARIDHSHPQPGGAGGYGKLGLESSGGLHHDQPRRHGQQHFSTLGNARFVIGKLPWHAGRVESHVQKGLGYINPNEHFVFHIHVASPILAKDPGLAPRQLFGLWRSIRGGDHDSPTSSAMPASRGIELPPRHCYNSILLLQLKHTRGKRGAVCASRTLLLSVSPDWRVTFS